MNSRKKTMTMTAFILIFLTVFSFYSYNVLSFFKIIKKKQIASQVINKQEESNINSITKNDEDLLNVDYKTFYNDLEPYGTWIKVDLTNSKIDSVSKPVNNDLSGVLRKILGINDAKADVDISWGIFYVWKPLPSLAVSVVAGNPAPAYYVPYTNGQWVYSNYGWYFRAPTHYEEIVHHYGRWVFVPSEGWVWIPGSVWAPAWVEWEEDDDYIAWAPIVPGVHFVSTYYFAEPFYRDYSYVVVERNYFLAPDIYNYCKFYGEKEHRKEFEDMRRIDGLKYKDNMVFDQGPNVTRFSDDLRNKIQPVNISRVSNKNDVRYYGNKYDVYSPKIKYANINNSADKNENYMNFSDSRFKDKNKNLDKSGLKSDSRQNNSNKSDNYKYNKDNNYNKNKENSSKRNNKNDNPLNNNKQNTNEKIKKDNASKNPDRNYNSDNQSKHSGDNNYRNERTPKSSNKNKLNSTGNSGWKNKNESSNNTGNDVPKFNNSHDIGKNINNNNKGNKKR